VPYQYLDIVTADEAFRAWGRTKEELFISAAHALTGVMVEKPEKLRPLIRKELILEEESLEFLLFAFLKEILFLKDAERVLLIPERVNIAKSSQSSWKLKAGLYGENLDGLGENLLVDVKAITLHEFSVERKDDLWQATVVVDV